MIQIDTVFIISNQQLLICFLRLVASWSLRGMLWRWRRVILIWIRPLTRLAYYFVREAACLLRFSVFDALALQVLNANIRSFIVTCFLPVMVFNVPGEFCLFVDELNVPGYHDWTGRWCEWCYKNKMFSNISKCQAN